jgi:hypothetical protein
VQSHSSPRVALVVPSIWQDESQRSESQESKVLFQAVRQVCFYSVMFRFELGKHPHKLAPQAHTLSLIPQYGSSHTLHLVCGEPLQLSEYILGHRSLRDADCAGDLSVTYCEKGDHATGIV